MRILFFSASLCLFCSAACLGEPTATPNVYGPIPSACKNPDAAWLKLTGGALVCHTRWTLANENGPNFWVFDRGGVPMLSTRIWAPDVWKLELKDIVKTNAGYAIVGVAYSNAGARSPFLALSDVSGNVSKFVQLTPFMAYKIAVTPDGNLWTLGENPPDDGMHWETYDMVREFAPDGTLIKTLLPSSNFAAAPGTLTSAFKHWQPVSVTIEGEPTITASKDRIAVFVPAAQQLVEFTLDGQVLNQLIIPAPRYLSNTDVNPKSPVMMETSLVMTPSGEVYASFQGGTGARVRHLDRSAKQWRPVPPIDSTSVVGLIGYDQETPIGIGTDTLTLFRLPSVP